MALIPGSFTQAEYLDVDSSTSNAPEATDPALFLRAILFGVGGAAFGGFLYAAFVALTHFSVGYLAVLVAYLAAKAMTIGSRGQGGWRYQVVAVCLTYLAVSAVHVSLIWWNVRRTGTVIPLSAHNVFLLARYGLLEPFSRLKTSAGSAVLDLLILFIGMRAAWRMTSGIPGAVRHPFAR